MRTACVGCSKTFASSEKADTHHRQKHGPVRRAAGGTINGRFVKKWPDDTPGIYRDGESWGDFADRRNVADLTPQFTLNRAAKTTPDSPISGQAVPQHVGTHWSHTPCLCFCHFGCDCDDQKHGPRVPDCSYKGCS